MCIRDSFDYDRVFKETLEDFVRKILPKNTNYKELLKFDLDDYVYEGVDIVLVTSVAGRHKEGNMRKYGHLQVADLLSKPPFKYSDNAKNHMFKLTYQTSSVGNLDENFLRAFCSSLFPDLLLDPKSGIGEDKKRSGPKISDFFRKTKTTDEEGEGGKGAAKKYLSITERVQMIYPTRDYIEKVSYGGPDHAGCLLLGEKNYEKPTFPKNIFCKYEGNPDYAFFEGCILHLKCFIVHREDGMIDDDTMIYLGSHNLSPAAWGRYEKNNTQLTIYNSELGVLFPPKKDSKAKKEQIIKILPFKFPPRKYDRGDLPWMLRLKDLE
eukprot:TRINITY_DN753_c0_g1_i9.p1 TRINITY_DN753_c0_g1~~TRINITY_DN753_c0_g1_i9.p1  ORF type:complete len:360 (-),score=67.43 TRINITY_DN753_c0_g1_i9:210-1178(-)